MPQAHKKKFRTLEGVFNHIMLQKNGWIEKKKSRANILTVPCLINKKIILTDNNILILLQLI